MTTPGSILGNAVLRREDPAILRGAARYFDDVPVTGCLHVAFVRSTVAHARVAHVDLSGAADVPGVVGAWSAATLPLEPLPGFAMVPAVFARPPLAAERVRFVGDIVAAVLGETPAAAVDGIEAVVVDYEPLPAVVDPEAAEADDAPLLFPEHGSNVAVTFAFGDGSDVLADADVVVSGRFVNQRVAAVPMEANGILVVPGDDGSLSITVPTQAPFGVRDGLVAALGLDAERVRVVAPAVGGGFGAKSGTFPEYVVATRLALDLGRPVKWTETRSENMVAMGHGRAQVQHVEMGFTREGAIVGLRARVLGDGGAYPGIGAFLPYLTRLMGQGVYRIPRIDVDARSVCTNTTPTGAYRGAGRPEAAAMLERIIDMGAAELGMDPAELRRRNFLAPDEFPLTTVTGAHYDVGEYARALDDALRIAGYDALRAEQAERRSRGDVVQLGIGLATYVEITAGNLYQEYGAVEVHTDGTVTATVGTSAHGQGHETAFAMIVAELLGVPMESVEVVQSDTDRVPRGSGTMGSRSLQTAGSALYRASEEVLVKARTIAAHLLEAAVEDVVLTGDGRIGVAGVPVSGLSWGELAAAAADPARLPDGMEPALAFALDFDQGEASYPFGAHVAVVEVDTETGRVELLRHVAVDDCGRIVNPLLVRGQQHGGIAQGVAQALWEQVLYDEDGNPLTTNLMDYAIPSAAELPSFEASNTETPTPLNPLGAKGIGESATIGSTPAVQNAVVDALAPFGVRHLDMPLTPERVWRAVRAGASPRAVPS